MIAARHGPLWRAVAAGASGLVVAAGALGGVATSGGASPSVVPSGATSAAAASAPVYAYGSNDFGQLGTGTTTDASVATPVSTPPGVTFTSVAGGSSHTLALGSDGTVYAWGLNNFGQLGDGTTTSTSTPVAVDLPSGTYTAVSAGEDQSYALSSSGEIYAWGNGSSGQLGDGTTTSSDTPVEVSSPGVIFTAISAGLFHAVALGANGDAYDWGLNSSGQLGDGTTTDSTVPVPVAPLPGVQFTAVAAGGAHTLALGSDGNVYAWGNGSSGQLGDGSLSDSSTPVQVELGDGATAYTAIAAGNLQSEALAKTLDGNPGRIYTWGDNELDQLGDGDHPTCPDGTSGCSDVPVTPYDATSQSFTSISAGYASGYAISSTGVAEAWGDDFYGQLGLDSTGTTQPTPTPIPLPEGTTVTALPSGSAASFGFVVTPRLSQSVSLGPLNAQVYGVAPVTIDATASSGLTPVLSFGPSSVCQQRPGDLGRGHRRRWRLHGHRQPARQRPVRPGAAGAEFLHGGPGPSHPHRRQRHLQGREDTDDLRLHPHRLRQRRHPVGHVRES